MTGLVSLVEYKAAGWNPHHVTFRAGYLTCARDLNDSSLDYPLNGKVEKLSHQETNTPCLQGVGAIQANLKVKVVLPQADLQTLELRQIQKWFFVAEDVEISLVEQANPVAFIEGRSIGNRTIMLQQETDSTRTNRTTPTPGLCPLRSIVASEHRVDNANLSCVADELGDELSPGGNDEQPVLDIGRLDREITAITASIDDDVYDIAARDTQQNLTGTDTTMLNEIKQHKATKRVLNGYSGTRVIARQNRDVADIVPWMFTRKLIGSPSRSDVRGWSALHAVNNPLDSESGTSSVKAPPDITQARSSIGNMSTQLA